MPPLERIDTILDTAVFWHLKSVDGYAQPILGAPVEIPCRWVDNQSLAMDPKGNTISVNATVIVDDDIEQFAVAGQPVWKTIVQGILWRGGLYDLPGTAFLPETGIMQIKTYNATPDVKHRHFRRSCGLMRFNDTLPKVVP